MTDALLVGAAGEHLVCADLLLRGIPATRTGIPGPWDVVAEVDGRLVRIQVKATAEARPFLQRRQLHLVGYTWAVRHGKGSTRAYAPGLVDIVALVALDVRRIAYVAASEARQTMQFPVDGSGVSPRTKRFEDFGWDRAVGVAVGS